jgi:hypothetical protein
VTHLTPEEFVDAAEGLLSPGRLQHLERCGTCRREVSALSALMGEAAGSPCPEPSPLFWEHLSARVRQAVRAEVEPTVPWGLSRLRWPALVPLGVLAALVVASVATMPHRSRPDAPLASVSSGSAERELEFEADDRDWSVLADLVGPLDWETAEAAGLALTPGDAELVVHELSAEERQELSRLITDELTRAKS